jgi:hypothetical protein
MPTVFYSGLTGDDFDRLEAIEVESEKLIKSKLGKRVVWSKTESGNLRLAETANSSVLLEIPSSEVARLSRRALLKRIADSLPNALPEAAEEPNPRAARRIKYTGVYIYVHGSDLAQVAGRLERELQTLLSRSKVRARLINERSERTPDLGPHDLPDWKLGLNLDRSNVSRDVLQSLLTSVGAIAASTKREFVIGYYDSKSGVSEDIAFMKSAREAETACSDVCSMLGL